MIEVFATYFHESDFFLFSLKFDSRSLVN